MKENKTVNLEQFKDTEYKKFHSALIPDVDPDRIIGVRVPLLRKLAKEMIKEGSSDEFIRALPHVYYEENNLHAFIISEIRDFDLLISEIEKFLPYVDNWATCDSLRPVAFSRNKEKLFHYSKKWMNSDREFTIRFGIEIMMVHFLDEDFSESYPHIISQIKSDKYYVNMMIAWYFATALAKQPSAVLPYIENAVLPLWVHNKTISKARESYRISEDMKNYLRSYKR